MSKKIVAIGGGENGRLREDGTRAPYNLEEIDREIIRLTNKEKPNFLFIGHSQPIERQEGYFRTMADIYGGRFGCNCRDLKSDMLNDKNKVSELISWADIIFEGGGDTLNMIKLWKETGFDQVLRKAWEDGKVMCGVSAGANCWFKLCNSDSQVIIKDNKEYFVDVECLNFINAYFVPHCEDVTRKISAKDNLKENKMVGLSVSSCAAIEIIDDNYRIIKSDSLTNDFNAYVLKSYWDNDNYIEKIVDNTEIEKGNLKQLLEKLIF